jgi:hypothetical protein
MENTGRTRILVKRPTAERRYVNTKREWLGKIVSRHGLRIETRNFVVA